MAWVRRLPADYQQWEAKAAGRFRRWPVGGRWAVFVLLPTLLLCSLGTPLAWIGGLTAEVSKGAASSTDAVSQYIDALGYGNEDGLLPILDDDQGDKLIQQWRSYRTEMHSGDTEPSKLEDDAEATRPADAGSVEVEASVYPVWWPKDGSGLSFQGSRHIWIFQTRNDGGWQIEKVTPYPWCGGHVTVDACGR